MINPVPQLPGHELITDSPWVHHTRTSHINIYLSSSFFTYQYFTVILQFLLFLEIFPTPLYTQPAPVFNPSRSIRFTSLHCGAASHYSRTDSIIKCLALLCRNKKSDLINLICQDSIIISAESRSTLQHRKSFW